MITTIFERYNQGAPKAGFNRKLLNKKGELSDLF